MDNGYYAAAMPEQPHSTKHLKRNHVRLYTTPTLSILLYFKKKFFAFYVFSQIKSNQFICHNQTYRCKYTSTNYHMMTNICMVWLVVPKELMLRLFGLPMY